MLLKYQDILGVGMRPHAGTGDSRSLPGKCYKFSPADCVNRDPGGHRRTRVCACGSFALEQEKRIETSSLVWLLDSFQNPA